MNGRAECDEQSLLRAWPPSGLLGLTRAGFEKDLAAELATRASESGPAEVYPIAAAGSGYVRLRLSLPEAAPRLSELVSEAPLFARRVYYECHWQTGLSAADRVAPILAHLPPGVRFAGVELAHPDTNEGKSLTRFLRGFRPHLERALKAEDRIGDGAVGPRLSLFFPDSSQVAIGWFLPRAEPVWPMGIPRLRLPRGAPSRSLLKLEEAVLTLMSEEERERLLQPGMHAVDLGAAPGGWSRHLIDRGLEVTAVDHGPMDGGIADHPGLHHVRADGFTWTPPEPVDWLVCDIVDKPARVADRMIHWLSRGWARHALFNLKLPMKRRYQGVRELSERLEAGIRPQRPGLRIRARHLYHDREEMSFAVIDAGEIG